MKKALVIGDVIDDIVVRPRSIIRQDTDTESDITLTPGGSAANFACWLAAEGVKVSLYASVAQTDLTRFEREFAKFNVDALLQGDPIAKTGAIVVIAEGQTRTFLTQRGANANLDLSGAIEILHNFDLVYISGYAVMGSREPDLARKLLDHAKDAKVQVAIDPGSAGFIADFGAQRFLNLTEGANFFLPSWEEGKVLTGEHQPEVILGSLAKRYGTTVLTLGAGGSAMHTGAEVVRQPAIEAETVDPTGAGDAFAAGFLAAVLSGKNPNEALHTANKLGAKAVTILGGRPLID